MHRFWSLLFLSVPIMGTLIVIGAATQFAGLHQLMGLDNSWLPPSIGERTEGVDYLFNMINAILGVVFMGTGLVLAFSLWRFQANGRTRASSRSGNLFLELIWTVIPAGILVFLAVHQLPYWQANKENHPRALFSTETIENSKLSPIARVVAFQYGWRFVYPGKDNRFDTRDDLIVENELYLPAAEEVVLELISQDVIHSFSINQLRLKQDVVPGMAPQVWFQITEPGEWEINCMELCGWGHFRMAARLIVMPRVDYDRWKVQTRREQHGF